MKSSNSGEDFVQFNSFHAVNYILSFNFGSFGNLGFWREACYTL